jgi:hypothetical protein
MDDPGRIIFQAIVELSEGLGNSVTQIAIINIRFFTLR